MTKKENILLTLTAVVLLIIFSFADLNISIALYNPNSIYGHIFEVIGEIPCSLVLLLSSVSLLVTRNKEVAWKNITSIIGFGILTVFSGLMLALMPLNYLKMAKMPLVVTLALILIVFAYVLISKIDKKYYPNLRRVAIVGLLFAFAAIFIINILKVLWGRMRFRAMAGVYDGFTPWYLPVAFAAGEEFKSFPSGHAANSAVIIALTLLPTIFPSLLSKKTYFKVFAYVWIVLVAISRIIMGAHFASDVLMGTIISLICFNILTYLIISKPNKVNLRQSKSLTN